MRFNGCLQLDFCAVHLEIQFLGRVRVRNAANLFTVCKFTQCLFCVKKNSRKIGIQLESKYAVFLIGLQPIYVLAVLSNFNSTEKLKLR